MFEINIRPVVVELALNHYQGGFQGTPLDIRSSQYIKDAAFLRLDRKEFASSKLFGDPHAPWREYDPVSRSDGVVTILPSLPKPRYKDFNEFVAEYDQHRWHEHGTVLVLSRHGTSLFNRVRLLNGPSRSPLLQDGEEEVHQLAKSLSPLPIESVYTSPIERAYHSAEILIEALGLARPIYSHHDLEEFERGVLAGRPRKMNSAEVDELFKKFSDPEFQKEFLTTYQISEREMQIVFDEARKHRKILQSYAKQVGMSEDEFVKQVTACENQMDCRPPLGESWNDGIAQAERFIFNEVDRHEKGAVLVVGHSSSHRMMIWKLLGYDIESIDQLYLFDQQIANINVLWRDANTKKWELLVLNSDRFGESGTLKTSASEKHKELA